MRQSELRDLAVATRNHLECAVVHHTAATEGLQAIASVMRTGAMRGQFNDLLELKDRLRKAMGCIESLGDGLEEGEVHSDDAPKAAPAPIQEVAGRTLHGCEVWVDEQVYKDKFFESDMDSVLEKVADHFRDNVRPQERPADMSEVHGGGCNGRWDQMIAIPSEDFCDGCGATRTHKD